MSTTFSTITVTKDTNLDDTNTVWIANCLEPTVTFTLPALNVSDITGRYYIIKRVDLNTDFDMFLNTASEEEKINNDFISLQVFSREIYELIAQNKETWQLINYTTK